MIHKVQTTNVCNSHPKSLSLSKLQAHLPCTVSNDSKGSNHQLLQLSSQIPALVQTPSSPTSTVSNDSKRFKPTTFASLITDPCPCPSSPTFQSFLSCCGSFLLRPRFGSLDQRSSVLNVKIINYAKANLLNKE